MNCNEIARILDEHALAELSLSRLAELEAHLLDCSECATQCLSAEQLAAFRAPCTTRPGRVAGSTRTTFLTSVGTLSSGRLTNGSSEKNCSR